MKKCLVVILLGILCQSSLHIKADNVLILTGVYSGENLYVQNPLLPDHHFSTEEVFVNQISVLSNPLTSAYTIDLSHLTVDQAVEIRITHKENYPPKIINAHVIGNHQVNFGSSYAPTADVFRWTNADSTTVKWLTHDEKGGGTFEIQRARMEEWLPVVKIPAKSITDESIYKVIVSHEEGENTYRIKLTDRDGYVTYSDPFLYTSR